MNNSPGHLASLTLSGASAPASKPVVTARRSPVPLEVAVCGMDELTPGDLGAWAEIRSKRPEFKTPFFSAAFHQAVQRARGDVSVAVVRGETGPVAFLPFHRQGRIAYPSGRFFNDAQNLIAGQENEVSWHWLLKSTGIKAYEFHALTGADTKPFPVHTCHDTIQTFSCNLGDDSTEYLRHLGKEHKTIGRQGQKSRKMEREVGPVSLEIDCRDIDVLRQTIRWKREQYNRTHILDLFTPPWTMRLMEELFDQNVPSSDLRGILSVLRAGDEVVAAHYGMIENGLLHYWFPTYNPAFGKYSPGTALFCSILQSATASGIHCLDMGYGEQPYKLKQADATGIVISGCVSRSRLYRTWRCAEAHAVRSLKKMPGKEPIKRVWRSVFPSAGISKID